MMLGTSSAAREAHESGGSGEVGGGAGGAVLGGGFSDEEKARIEEGEGGGGSGGNRWPREETLALLKIRSEMGVAFRDSNLKGPLWEEVSRKMAELGYKRSAKKCKEKFENIYKYHKRTRDGRAAKGDGKTYRFFEQLEALESSPSPLSSISPPPRLQHPPPLPISSTTTTLPAAAAAARGATITPPPIFSHVTVSSAAIPVSFSPALNNPLPSAIPQSRSHLQHPHLQPQNSTNPSQGYTLASSHPHISSSLLLDSMSSSSTSSDEDIGRRHKRKRKLRDFFERLMKDVISKQEELQKKFLETLEKRERERMIREEAWRVQEMARMNRELDLLAQERSKAAAKDAAMVAYLQTMTGQQSRQNPSNNAAPQVQASLPQEPQNPLPPPQPLPDPIPTPPTVTPLPALVSPAPPVSTPTTLPVSAVNVDTQKNDKVGENFMTPRSSSRWPKAEVEALINLRTNLDIKYSENGPKGPLWEEISTGMSNLGYSRSSKRCKEKWENINKYFKKVKESNKKRPEDSKTCPYFHQLEALYKEKGKTDPSTYATPAYMNTAELGSENLIIPLMVRPEQQWPLPRQESAGEDHESGNMDENEHEEEGDDEDEDDDDDDDEGEGYEIVTNKQAAATSMSVATTAAE